MSPMPKRYTVDRTVRLTTEIDALLREKAKTMGLPPAVVIRLLVEHSVGGGVLTPLIEDKSVE